MMEKCWKFSVWVCVYKWFISNEKKKKTKIIHKAIIKWFKENRKMKPLMYNRLLNYNQIGHFSTKYTPTKKKKQRDRKHFFQQWAIWMNTC